MLITRFSGRSAHGSAPGEPARRPLPHTRSGDLSATTMSVNYTTNADIQSRPGTFDSLTR